MSDPLSVSSLGNPDVAEHTHHWLIGNQDGPSSPGVCKECGERRDFSNSFERRKPSWMTRAGSAQQNASSGSEGKVYRDSASSVMPVVPPALQRRRVPCGKEPHDGRVGENGRPYGTAEG